MNKKKKPKACLLNLKNKDSEKTFKLDQEKHIAWNFRYIEKDHPKYKCSFYDFIRSSENIVNRFEGKTIQEIERDSIHNHSWKESDKLDHEFTDILKKKHLDQEEIYQLHLNSATRLWGILRGNIFCIICFDKRHSIYKTQKKHT